jgi:hypothetical protein
VPRRRESRVEMDIGRASMKLLIMRLLVWLSIAASFLVAPAWVLDSKLLAPANYQVTLPADFRGRAISIPGPGHPIAGWWVDRGGTGGMRF